MSIYTVGTRHKVCHARMNGVSREVPSMFIASKGPPQKREALIQELAVLSKDGVGLRRNEGFGTVIVSDDFHRRFRNQEEHA